MFITLDARMIMPHMTGVGRYLLGLASGLRKLPGDEQYELWLQSALPGDHPAWELASENLLLRRLPIRQMDVRQNWVLPLELHRRSPDLLHFPHFDLPPTVTTPVVATIHDLKYISRPDFFPHMSGVKRLVMRWMIASTLMRARLVLTDSEYTRQDLIHHFSLPEQKSHVAYLGVDAAYNQSISTEILQRVCKRYQLNSDFILYVGERRPHKNIAGLLRAFAQLQKLNDRPYQLVIAGQPYTDYKEPERLVENLALGNSVRFLNYVPDAHLPALYRSAAAFALLSFYEGFGLPVIEAMACGTPVIAANTTCLPEICNEACLLVEPDQPEQIALGLNQILPNGALREQNIARGLQRAREFTWQACAEKTLEVYRDAIR